LNLVLSRPTEHGRRVHAGDKSSKERHGVGVSLVLKLVWSGWKRLTNICFVVVVELKRIFLKIMAKLGGSAKKEEKMVTKVGMSLGAMKVTVVEWLSGPTHGTPRAAIDWKMEAFIYTKIVAQNYVSDETNLLRKAHKRLRLHILVHGKPDPIAASWPRLPSCFCIMTAQMGS